MLLAADAGLRTEPGVNLTRARFAAFRTETVFASTEGALCEQRVTECGGGIAAVAVEGGRQPDPLLPRLARRPRGRRRATSTSSELELPGHAPRVASEAVGAAARAGLPARPHDADPRRRAARPPGARVGRPRGRARPGARPRGLVRRHELRAGGRDRLAPLRLRARERDRRRHHARAASGSFRWDDEGVEGRPVPIVRDGVLAGFLSSRETASEIGLERSGGCMRAEGFSRQPIVRMTNVNLEPGDAGHARRPDRGHRRRPPDRDEPVLVDRQPPAPLPVRGRGGAGRSGAASAAGCCATRATPGVTPEFWGSCDAVCSPAEWRLISLLDCGKGEPGPGDARLARRGAGALPRRRGRRGVIAGRRSPSGPPRQAGAGRASRSSTRERSLMLRFAAGRPDPVDRDRRRDRRDRGPASRGTWAGRRPTRSTTRSLARVRRAGEARGRAPRRPPAKALSRASTPEYESARPATPSTRRRRELDPGGGRRGARGRRSRWPREHGVEAHGIWTVAEQEQAWAIAVEGGRSERRTDAFMKVICIAPERPQRLRGGEHRSWRGAIERASWPSGPRAKALAAGRAGRARRRASTRSCSSRRRSAGCATCSRAARSTASRTPRAAARSTAGSASRSRRPRSTSPTRPRHPRTLPRSFDAEGTREGARCR